jgi:flagellar biogenesis protein FliO
VKVSRQLAVAFFFLTSVLSSSLLWGDDPLKSLPGTSEDAGDQLMWAVLKVVGFLLLLGAIAFFANDFFRGRRLGRFKIGREKRLRVADVCALGNRQFVFVIECGGQRHLLGGGGDGVRYLSRLPDEPGESFETKLDAEIHSNAEKDEIE